MPIESLSLNSNYWETFRIGEPDLDFLNNFLLEIETPQSTQELLQALVTERIRIEKGKLENPVQPEGKVYLPRDHYAVGDKIIFPAFEWKKGTVKSVHSARNPEFPPFDVIEVTFSPILKMSFASGLEEHKLNKPLEINKNDPGLDIDRVMRTYHTSLLEHLNASLKTKPDLVQIAGRWFPRSLLVDVNIGHLNLAEAVLDMTGGGPLSTKEILDQIELPTDVNLKLTEFSLNLAFQEDSRFDEVGTSGKIAWFLKKLEPDGVKEVPVYLQYHKDIVESAEGLELLDQLESEVCDELELPACVDENSEEITTALIFPHWRAGTLPLSARMAQLFPTAYESPRVQFNFIDGSNQTSFPGWVVRESKYVYGLSDFYKSHGLIPGSLVHITRSKTPGEVIINVEKRKQNREWIRTVLIGADGGIVFAMLKQQVNATFDERMAIVIPDIDAVEQFWLQPKGKKKSFESAVYSLMKELAKLNTQGHVHAQELYSVVNLIQRCPPGPIITLLTQKAWASHLGDLYFRIDEKPQEVKVND
ncbi:MAG: hypothetical protein AB9891_18975 [Anaerolineaceae bacterium]